MEYIVEKIGMSREVGVPSFAVTLLKVKDAKVCEMLENDKAIVAYSLGKKFSKTIEGTQKKYSLSKEFNRFVTLSVANSEAGDIDLSSLEVSETPKKAKVSFKSKGRGFTGVVKRYNFKGGPATHGSRFHRTGGSIGNAEWPGRVQKGRKMAGHHGNVTITGQNEIISFDTNTKILVVKGSVAGANGSVGKLRID
jgi:large subunit ribosomal protein L3